MKAPIFGNIIFNLNPTQPFESAALSGKLSAAHHLVYRKLYARSKNPDGCTLHPPSTRVRPRIRPPFPPTRRPEGSKRVNPPVGSLSLDPVPVCPHPTHTAPLFHVSRRILFSLHGIPFLPTEPPLAGGGGVVLSTRLARTTRGGRTPLSSPSRGLMRRLPPLHTPPPAPLTPPPANIYRKCLGQRVAYVFFHC